MTWLRTSAGRLLNLDCVARVIEAPTRIELRFVDGLTEVLTTDEDIAKIRKFLGADGNG